MAKLVLSEDLANLFVGGLLTIARADGEVNTEETAVLRDISAELSSGFEIDFETLLFEHVNASDLAEALSKGSGGPFRGASTSPPAEIAEAFLEAARRVALADGESNPRENVAIRAFSRALDQG
jgi:tellurite resistance protein